MTTWRKAGKAACLAALLGISFAVSADDIDIYDNIPPSVKEPPMTVIMLDLNAAPTTIVCNNVITNPSGDGTCGALQNILTLTQWLQMEGLGLNTLPLSLLSGTLTPLLNTALSAIPSAVGNLLVTTLGSTSSLLQITNQQAVFLALQEMVTTLINSRVAVMLSHGNTNAGLTIHTAPPTCAFADLGSPAGLRAATTNCSNGGYFFLGFQDLANVGSLLTTITNRITGLFPSLTHIQPALPSAPGAGYQAALLPPYQGKELYNELYHYLVGGSIYNGHLGYYDWGNGNGTLNLNQTNSLLAWDTTIESGSSYKSALDTYRTCDVVNVLNVQLTDSAYDSDSDADVAQNFPGSSVNGSVTFPSLVQAAANTGFTYKGNVVKLRSYFIVQNNLSSLAALSGVGANVVTYANTLGLLGLGQSVAQFLQPVLVTDTTMLTPTFTPSRTQSSGFDETVFFPLFHPTASGQNSPQPAWYGNLKRLRYPFNSPTATQAYLDANGNSAIASDGGISTSALTYWTQSGQAGTTGADGRTTNLGGAGAQIPGYSTAGTGNPGVSNTDATTSTPRQVFFDDPSSATGLPAPAAGVGLTALTANSTTVLSDLTNDLAGAASNTERTELLYYARGYDVGTSSADKGTTNVKNRAWMMGALLHSHPIAVDYGARTGYSASNPDIRIYMGTADGFFHAIRNTTTGGADSGAEAWAFMPRATMGNLKTLRDNALISPFPYGVDGAPSAILIDRSVLTGNVMGPADGIIDSTNSYDHAYVYFGLRRGGNAYYAMDVTNPDSPKLMWRIDPVGGVYSANASPAGQISGSATQFGNPTATVTPTTALGLTFGTPAVGQMLVKDSTHPTGLQHSVLIFGGGYNGGVSGGVKVGKDLNNSQNSTAKVGTDDYNTVSNKGVGNALFIVDAVTGQMIWRATYGLWNSAAPYASGTQTFSHPLMVDSVAANVTALDTNGDGIIDRVYFADTGGRVWRADFPGYDPSKWTVTPIASLGRHDPGASGFQDDRRFFGAPDMVPVRGGLGTYDAVLIGSGDREDPFNGALATCTSTTCTNNWFYELRDTATGIGKSPTDTTTNAGIITTENDSRLIHQSSLPDLTSACATTTTNCTASVTLSAGQSLATGWKIQLSTAGEKAFTAPTTIGGTVTFSTFLPPLANTSTSTSCVPSQGISMIYSISLIDSSPVSKVFGTLDPSGARSIRANAPGLPGDVNAITPYLQAIGSQFLTPQAPSYYKIFWRERRQDDAQPVPQQ